MKYNAHAKEIEELKEVPGLIKLKKTYKISGVDSNLDYTGPFMPQEMWHQILSFFKWTNSEHHSESQVRWYISVKDQTWRAWAYPQEERTGMSARELGDTPEFKEQRAQFNDDWVYYGTVHHHCNGGAFQSGTDKYNEENQDGLHITVGNMDQPRHTIHARLYHGDTLYEPNMSAFWNIGDEIAKIVPSDLWDKVARYQMCATASVEFPEQWKKNVIPAPKAIVVPRDNEYPFRTGFVTPGPLPDVVGNGKKGKGKDKEANAWDRALVALRNILKDRCILSFSDGDIVREIVTLYDDPICQTIINECVDRNVSINLLRNRVMAIQSETARTKAIPEKTGDGLLGGLTEEEANDLLCGMT